MEDHKKLEEGFGNQKKHTSEEEIDYSDNQWKKDTRIVSNQDLVSHENEQNILDQPLQQQEEEEPPLKQKSKRVATLDAFRGLTIVVYI